MKKYVKPMITLERYELTQNIANCAWELQSGSAESCNATPDSSILAGMNGSLFTETTKDCVYIPGVNYEDYCYQNGSGSPFNVFQS